VDVGDVLGRGGLGVAVETVFSVDDVTGMVCWEVEVKVDVEDRVIGRGLGMDIWEFVKVADEDSGDFWLLVNLGIAGHFEVWSGPELMMFEIPMLRPISIFHELWISSI
jgi:hypothetical protein